MEYINYSPLLMVDDVAGELRQLSGLCTVLTYLQDGDNELSLEHISAAMGVIRDCLDRQIDALNAIQWPQEKAVGA